MHNPDTIHNNTIWKIDEEQAGQRLDRYLVAIQKNISRTTAQQMIAEGTVLVNGRLSKPGYMLRMKCRFCR
jgi:23S rRNA pseudouridine1911/1915/1917 synthase